MLKMRKVFCIQLLRHYIQTFYIDKTFVRQHLAQEIFSPEVLLNLTQDIRQYIVYGNNENKNQKFCFLLILKDQTELRVAVALI